MSLRSATSTCMVLLVLLVASLSRAQSPARFALIIGNNATLDSHRTPLSYADDDAITTHRLLTEAHVDAVLLATLDKQSADEWPEAHARAPSAKELALSVEELSTKVESAAKHGQATELIFFYSGHGDVDERTGEGYVLLADSRLTRSGLASLLSRIGAQRSHVIVDACKSFYLVNGRGRGGRRTPYTGPPLYAASAAQLSSTGYILSTASDGESHEWERYHGGILSHELHSALRGAADVDQDGALSYAEIGAFLSKANERVLPHFRPNVLVQGPANDPHATLLSWSSVPSLELGAGDWGHVYVEGARGERLLDMHPARETSSRLWAPAERPLYVRREDGAAEYEVRMAGLQSVDISAGRPPTSRPKGVLHNALEQLFAAPFARLDVERFASVSAANAELMPGPLRSDSTPSHVPTWIAGTSAAVFGGTGLVLWLEARREYKAVDRWKPGHTPAEIVERQSTGKTFQTLADISCGLSAAAVLTGLVLYISKPDREPELPAVHFSLGGMEWRQQF